MTYISSNPLAHMTPEAIREALAGAFVADSYKTLEELLQDTNFKGVGGNAKDILSFGKTRPTEEDLSRFEEKHLERIRQIQGLLDVADALVGVTAAVQTEVGDDLMAIVNATKPKASSTNSGAKILPFPLTDEAARAASMARHPSNSNETSARGRRSKDSVDSPGRQLTLVIPLYSRNTDSPSPAPHWTRAPQDGNDHLVAIPRRDLGTFQSLPPENQE